MPTENVTLARMFLSDCSNHDGSLKIELYRKENSIVEIESAKYFWYKGHQYYMSHFPSITVDPEVEIPKTGL